MKQFGATRTLLCICLLTVSLAACDGCSEKKTTPDLGTPAQDLGSPGEPDLGPPEDALKEAREAAETAGQLKAVNLGDSARLVASQIEAARTAVTKSTTPKTRIKTGGESKETGKIAANDAERVFRKFDGAMKKCYERALKKRPGLEGKVKLMVVVGASGSVTRANASGLSLKDSSVNNCMEALTPRMKFPKPEGGNAKLQKVYSFSPAL